MIAGGVVVALEGRDSACMGGCGAKWDDHRVQDLLCRNSFNCGRCLRAAAGADGERADDEGAQCEGQYPIDRLRPYSSGERTGQQPQ